MATVPPLPAEVEAAIARGDRFEAFRLLREATGLGLIEATQALEAAHPGFYGDAVSQLRPPPALPANVEAAIARGDRIEAIKLLRDATGMGLARAKQAVEARVQADHGDDDDEEDEEDDAESTSPAPTGLGAVTAALHAGRKIEAIRLYRELTGVGLKEAKEAVDAMDPGFHASIATPGGLSPGEVPRASAWWAWVLLAIAAAAGAAWFLR